MYKHLPTGTKSSGCHYFIISTVLTTPSSNPSHSLFFQSSSTMARGKQAPRSSSIAASARTRNNRNLQKLSSRTCNEKVTRESIDHHWNSFSFCSINLRSFVTLFPQNVTIHALIKFWSLPINSPFASHATGVGISNCLLILAHLYLKLGETHITHALIRCSAFLVQLKVVPMAKMVAMSSTDLADPKKLPHYLFAAKACIEGKEVNYLRDMLPYIESSSST